jgi:excisionase family DNA binding protein
MDIQFLSVAQTAKALNISTATVRRMVAKNEIPHRHIAGTLRIPTAWVEGLATETIEQAR